MKTLVQRSAIMIVICFLLFGSAVGVAPAYALTLTVTNTNDSGTGSLRDIVGSANPGDTVNFDPSLAGQTIHFASTININQDVTIDGSALRVPIILSGDSDSDGVGDVQILNISSGVTVAINSLVFAKGQAINNTSGAIENAGTLTVNNSSFADNYAENGGGAIFSYGPSITVSNSTFTRNISGGNGGGGGAILATKTATISNTVFSYNSNLNSVGGGGLYYGDGTLTVTNSTFTHNTSATHAGGIEIVNGTANITGSTFDHNSASGGASIAIETGTVTVTNSTFASNSATGLAGGIYNNGTLNLTNSTFSDNTAVVGASISNSNVLNYANNIFANSNTALDCYSGGATIGTHTNNLIEDTSPTCSPDIINVDPMLGPLADNGGPTQTMALLPGSPAIDAGDDTTCTSIPTDQRGVSRSIGTHCDLGAYEADYLLVTDASDPGDGVCDSTCSLRDAILAANADANRGTILFNGNYTITLGAFLPSATEELTIDGAGHLVILNGANTYQIMDAQASLHLKNLIIQNGSSTNGGAILTRFPSSIANVSFQNNTASSNGGAIYNDQTTLTITNSTFTGNSAGVGGGGGAIKNDQGTLIISNSTFSNNSADTGGAIAALYSASTPTTTIYNSTFSNNSATTLAGGVYNNGTLNYANNIIVNSTGGDCVNDGTLGTNLNNLVEDASCSATLSGDPNLGNLTNHGGNTDTFDLPANSTAVNAGNDAVCASMLNDQRGFPRLIGTHCDIGAYEYNPPPVVNSIVRANGNPTNASSVDYTVTFSEPVTGVDTADFTMDVFNLTGASITGLTGSGASYTVTVDTGTGTAGTLTLDVLDNNTILDNLGAALGGPGATDGDFTGETYTVDRTAPSISSTAPAGSTPSHAASVNFTVTFSEAVTSVDNADFSLSNSVNITAASIASVSGTGTTRTVSVNTGSGNGTIRLDVPNTATITDLAGNALGGLPYTSGQSYTIDKTAPTVSSIALGNISPTSKVNVNFTVNFSEAVTGITPADFSLTTGSGITGATVSGVTGIGMTRTVTVNTGSGDGTIRLNIPNTATITDIAGNALSGLPYMIGPSYTVNKTLTFTSVSAQDGWVLESTETSGRGSTFNSTAKTFNLGDDATKKQYRSILSFSTGSIPDNATITGVTLKVKKSTIVGGGNPVGAFQGFMADIKNGFFSTSATLQPTDFQAIGTASYGPFIVAPVSNVYSINLTGGKLNINKLTGNSGLTQIRLRFKLDDNNNAIANYLSLFSGNATNIADRPQLVITYYVP